MLGWDRVRMITIKSDNKNEDKITYNILFNI